MLSNHQIIDIEIYRISNNLFLVWHTSNGFPPQSCECKQKPCQFLEKKSYKWLALQLAIWLKPFFIPQYMQMLNIFLIWMPKGILKSVLHARCIPSLQECIISSVLYEFSLYPLNIWVISNYPVHIESISVLHQWQFALFVTNPALDFGNLTTQANR